MSEPTVLIVDDDPESPDVERITTALENAQVSVLAIDPPHLSRQHLKQTDLFLVDYVLDEWTELRDLGEVERPEDKQLIAMRPRDGLALAATIRSQLPEADVRGIALLSNNLSDVVKGFSPSVTEHAAARVNGLDWAFDKRLVDGLPDVSERVADLARAVREIGRGWPKDDDDTDREAALWKLLALPDAEWTEVAVRDVHAAQPPVNQFADATHGLSVLRWIGQRILPYPTFLLDARRLAMACGVDPLTYGPDQDAFEDGFDSMRYRGPLGEFLGPRWWRAGVRRLVRDWTGESQPGPQMRAALADRLDLSLPPLDPPGSVLCIDGELKFACVRARERAVRVRPDDWPPFAETGWMDEALVREHPELEDLVEPSDRARLKE